MSSSKAHVPGRESADSKLLKEHVFSDNAAAPFLDSRHLISLMTTFYTYLHPTPIGLAKTHLQHLISAAAINLVRIANWPNGIPTARTRCSWFAALQKIG